MAALSSYCRMFAKTFSHRLKSTQQINSIVNQISHLRLSPATSHLSSKLTSPLITPSVCGLHTSATCNFHKTQPSQDLMEFFDKKETWGETTVKAGRPYRVDELRIKSNQDLHKLWYVLLKERNMLLTMEAEHNRHCELFPNPERIAKVEESMENILQVVKERDNAVSLLETGKPSDPGGAYVRDFLGRVVWRKFTEHSVPPHMNKVYRLLYPRRFKRMHMKYLPLWREKLALYQWGKYRAQVRLDKKLIKEFPHLEGKLKVPKPKEPRVY